MPNFLYFLLSVCVGGGGGGGGEASAAPTPNGAVTSCLVLSQNLLRFLYFHVWPEGGGSLYFECGCVSLPIAGQLKFQPLEDGKSV